MTRACIALLLLLAASASAQTTGAISGRIFDAQTSQPVASATVTASSPAMQGEQSARTDPAGEFVLGLLPPGRYTLYVQADGHQAFTQEGLEVGIGRELRLRLSILPDVMVAAPFRLGPQLPLIPVTTARAAAVIPQEQFEMIPYGRDQRSWEATSLSIPGVLPNGEIFGSPATASRYRIDGLDVNDPATALFGRRLLQQFVQQVGVETRALGAEYGRASSGVVEALTKSGGNELHGSAFLDWTPVEVPQKTLRYDLDGGAELGGALEKNRVWFYGGFAPVLHATTSGAETDYQYVGKLTWRPADGQTFVLSAVSDDFALRYLGNVFDRKAQVEAIAGWSHHGSSDSVQARAAVSQGADLFGRHRFSWGADTAHDSEQAEARWTVAGFVRDTWSPIEELFLDAGLRVDHQSSPSRTEALPRAAVSWDFGGTGASRLWASYGRFLDPAPLGADTRLIEHQIGLGVDRQLLQDLVGGLGFLHKEFSGAPDGRTSYDGLTVSVTKPFSAGTLLRASYTRSWLRGVADPAAEAPHVFKLDAAYAYEWTAKTTLTFGSSLRAIDASPWLTTLDVRLAAVHVLPTPYLLTVTVDALNLLDEQDAETPPLAIRFGARLSF